MEERAFLEQLASYMDFSCVQAQNTKEDIRRMLDAAEQFHPAAVFSLPCYTPYLAACLRKMKDATVRLGGVVGFPSGAQSTAVKCLEARELLALGCRELDMVLAVGKLKDGDIDYVREDIRSIVELAGAVPVKVIVEAGYLTDEELTLACRTAVQANADFVKTGTGWSGIPSTVEMVQKMKQAVGNTAKVKAAGGVRTLDTVLRMYEAGCERFGIGTDSALKILQEAKQRLERLEAEKI